MLRHLSSNHGGATSNSIGSDLSFLLCLPLLKRISRFLHHNLRKVLPDRLNLLVSPSQEKLLDSIGKLSLELFVLLCAIREL